MPTPKSSPHLLTERSASFNRADLKQSIQIKASNTDFVFDADAESLENLTCTKSFVRHVRHSSLDSHPSALHPINLNAKFDHFRLPASPAKVSVKVSIILDDLAEKESSFFSAPYEQREGGGEQQEELSLEPHESLLQDAQEESFSASLSAESKSPCEHPDFVLWGNATFCLSDTRDLIRSGSQTQSEMSSEASIKNHVQNGEQNTRMNYVEGRFSAKDEGLLSLKDNYPSRDEGISLDRNEPSHPLVATAISTVEHSIEAAEVSVTRQSSIGSNLSVHDSLTIRHTQAHHSEEFLKEEPLMSSEAQSCCLDFDVHEIEASAASDGKLPADKMQDMENTSNEISEERNNEQVKDKYTKEAAQIGHLSSPHLFREVHQQGVSMAAEELCIRAELELEIENDLEQEIKTKIYLLNRRLEELTALKAIRNPNQEQSKTHTEEGISFSSNGQEDQACTTAKEKTAASLPRSPSSSGSSKNKTTLQHSKADKMSGRVIVTSTKKHLATGETDKEANSIHANTPLTSWRKFATASGWTPHTKDCSSQLSSSEGSLKSYKVSKPAIDGPSATFKPKVQIESTSSFKQDYQSWTGIASSKKFDWIRTLRSEVPSTPRMSSMRTDSGEVSSSFLPSSKETIYGNVARTLFTDDGLSTPRKTIVKAQRNEVSSTPLAGSSKRSVVSGTKTPRLHVDMVDSTPRICITTPGLPKSNQRSSSTSAKPLSQKPPSGIHASRDPTRRTPEVRQAMVSSTPRSKPTSVSRATPQQASSKVSRIEKKTTVGAPASTHQISLLKNSSPMPAEKLKRSENELPNSSVRSSGSKEIKNTPAKTPSKQVSPPSKSRIAPSIKPVSSTPQVNKTARTVPSSSNLAKRQSCTPLKTIGASTTREKGASRP